MFKGQQSLILVILLLMFSCHTPTKNPIKEANTEDDMFLKHIDSLLVYADTEIENITHNHEENDRKYQILINEIKKLKKEISNRNNLIQKITSEYNSLNDSLISVNRNQKNIISQKNYVITNLEKKIYQKNLELDDLNTKYENETNRLDSIISVLNNYLDFLNEGAVEISNEKKDTKKESIILKND